MSHGLSKASLSGMYTSPPTRTAVIVAVEVVVVVVVPGVLMLTAMIVR